MTEYIPQFITGIVALLTGGGLFKLLTLRVDKSKTIAESNKIEIEGESVAVESLSRLVKQYEDIIEKFNQSEKLNRSKFTELEKERRSCEENYTKLHSDFEKFKRDNENRKAEFDAIKNDLLKLKHEKVESDKLITKLKTRISSLEKLEKNV